MSGGRSLRPVAGLAATSLWLAMLACGTTGTGPDAAATVNALNVYVAQTLTAKANLQPSAATTDTPPAAASLAPDLTAVPSALPAVATADLPSPTPPPTDNGPLSRPNGLVYHAAAAAAAPVIDGNLADWPALPYAVNTPTYKPENWTGPQDNSFTFDMTWDAGYLYLAASVVDDVHVQTQHNEFIYKGDSLEILLDADLAGDFTVTHLNADDYQLGLSPGALNGDTPEAWLWFPVERSGPANAVKLAVRPAGQGYQLEAAIPWALLNVTPAGGSRYGLVVSSSDDDTPNTAQQESLISSVSTRKLVDPTTWGTLALDP
jgi:hypothetical protein